MTLLLLLLSCGGEPAVVDSTVEGIPLHFVDVASERLPALLPAERASPQLVDLDGDGRLDLVEGGAHGPRLHRSGGASAPFEAAVSLLPLSEAPEARQLICRDLDEDGDIDLLFAGGGGAWAALQGEGLSFELQALDLPADLVDLAHVDLDGDGLREVLGLSSSGVSALLAFEGARWRAQDLGLPEGLSGFGAMALGDVDGDGAPDLLLAGDSVGDRLYLNDGGGRFLLAPPDALPPAEPSAARDALIVDLDGDGDAELFIASAGQDRLLRNDGGGRFTDETLYALGPEGGVAVAARAVDLDLDGLRDLVVANADGPLALLRSDGEGRLFDYKSAFPGFDQDALATGLAVGDVDDDGDPDLFVARGDLRRPWLLESWSPKGLDDADLDGVPDALDVCPDDPDPQQADRDAHPFACEGEADCLSRRGCQLIAGLEDSLYLWCEGVRVWQDARDTCASWGADLAVLDSGPEHDFIVAAGVTGAWIGLSDAEVEGSWRWVDGTQPGYQAWSEGEPNDSGGAEDCVHLSTGGLWNDRSCEGALGFLCEAPAQVEARDGGDACDNCAGVVNVDQSDVDVDGAGDLCDAD